MESVKEMKSKEKKSNIQGKDRQRKGKWKGK